MVLATEKLPVSHLPELDWLNSHIDELRSYAGEWLAVLPEGIAAHDKNLKQLFEIVDEKKIINPLYYYIHPDLFSGHELTSIGEPF
jgi:hypothetical protein